MMTKMNTFTDFIACAEALIKMKYTSKDRLVVEGGSAGGLLMGVVSTCARICSRRWFHMYRSLTC